MTCGGEGGKWEEGRSKGEEKGRREGGGGRGEEKQRRGKVREGEERERDRQEREGRRTIKGEGGMGRGEVRNDLVLVPDPKQTIFGINVCTK